MFIVSALAQVLSAGSVVLMSHGVGRKDFDDMRLVFNQAIGLSAVCSLITIVLLFLLARPYMQTISTDAAVVDAGVHFIHWVSPGYALVFPMAVLGSTMRGLGVVQPAVLIMTLTVVLNAALAPFFIAGWGIGPALGVRGAGLATSVSVIIGLVLLAAYFHRSIIHLALNLALSYPRAREWRRILAIGLPAGAEFSLMFLSAGVVYFVIRDLGASAQAGFGIGSRILQAILLPSVALAFVAGPIAGQNFGARNTERVREVFRTTALFGSVLMLFATVVVQWWPDALVGLFDTDAYTAATAELFLKLMSWTFVAQGLVYTCAYMFQGLGNCVPSLISACVRFVLFAAPAAWLSRRPDFHIHQIWLLLTASVAMQAALSLWLLRLEFRRKLEPRVA